MACSRRYDEIKPLRKASLLLQHALCCAGWENALVAQVLRNVLLHADDADGLDGEAIQHAAADGAVLLTHAAGHEVIAQCVDVLFGHGKLGDQRLVLLLVQSLHQLVDAGLSEMVRSWQRLGH